LVGGRKIAADIGGKLPRDLPCNLVSRLTALVRSDRGARTRSVKLVDKDGQPRQPWQTITINDGAGDHVLNVFDNLKSLSVEASPSALRWIMLQLIAEVNSFKGFEPGELSAPLDANQPDPAGELSAPLDANQPDPAIDSLILTPDADIDDNNSVPDNDDGEDDGHDAACIKSRDCLPDHVWWSLAKSAFIAKHGTKRKCFFIRNLAPCALEESWHQRKRAEYFANTGITEEVAEVTPVKRKRITDFFSPNKNRLR